MVDIPALERELHDVRAELEHFRSSAAALARFPFNPDRCSEETSRRGELGPCDKPAVAVRLDVANDGAPYPVCSYHARAPMIPLAQLLRRTP